MPASDLKQGCQLADPIFKLQCWQPHVSNNRIIEHNSQRICWMGSSSSVLHTPSVSVTFLAIPSATCSINDCSSGRLLILLLILLLVRAFQQNRLHGASMGAVPTDQLERSSRQAGIYVRSGKRGCLCGFLLRPLVRLAAKALLQAAVALLV